MRTAAGMQSFAHLDNELSRLDAELGFAPTLPASRPPLLPPLIGGAPGPNPSQALLLGLVRSLNPITFPSPQPPAAAAVNGDTIEETPPASTPPPSLPPRKADEPPDELWWDTVGASALASTSGSVPRVPIALASGLPSCPWEGVAAPEPPKERKVARVKGGAAATAVDDAGASAGMKGKGKGRRRALNAEVPGLGGKMRQNFETLRKIRRLHGQLANGSRGLDAGVSSLVVERRLPLTRDFKQEPPSATVSDNDSETEDTKPARPAAYLNAGIPRSAFQSQFASQAASDSLGLVSNRILGHAGFDGGS